MTTTESAVEWGEGVHSFWQIWKMNPQTRYSWNSAGTQGPSRRERRPHSAAAVVAAAVAVAEPAAGAATASPNPGL